MASELEEMVKAVVPEGYEAMPIPMDGAHGHALAGLMLAVAEHTIAQGDKGNKIDATYVCLWGKTSAHVLKIEIVEQFKRSVIHKAPPQQH